MLGMCAPAMAQQVEPSAETPKPSNVIIVTGRRGGPEFVDSELARLGHLVGLAASLARP